MVAGFNSLPPAWQQCGNANLQSSSGPLVTWVIDDSGSGEAMREKQSRIWLTRGRDDPWSSWKEALLTTVELRRGTPGRAACILWCP